MLQLLLGDPNIRKLKHFQPLVTEINLLEEDISPLSDEELRLKTNDLRQRLENVLSPEKQLAIKDKHKNTERNQS